MAQATEKQVRDLERVLGEQFFLLVQGAEFRINLARKYGLKSNAFKKYSEAYTKILRKWITKEVKYERELLKTGVKGIIASGKIKFEDFFYSKELPKLIAAAKKWNTENTTIGRMHENLGFIPLLIWAVIAIVSAFSATVIVDDLTTTAEEKQELMEVTAQTIKDLNLTPQQASALLEQTQEQASSTGGGGIMNIVKWGLIGYLGIQLIPIFTKK